MYCKNCGKQIAEMAVICMNCGVPCKSLPRVAPKPEIQPETKETPKKVNGFALAGFITAVASIALGVLSVYINRICYTGVNFQFYFTVPLIAALVFSIIGTVKAKKLKSGLGFGIAGIVISGGTIVLAVLFFILLLYAAVSLVGLLFFIIAML